MRRQSDRFYQTQIPHGSAIHSYDSGRISMESGWDVRPLADVIGQNERKREININCIIFDALAILFM